MRLNFIRLTKGYVDSSAIRFPARDAGSVMFVGISNSLVILLAILVLFSIRIRITTAPKCFDKLFALFVCRQPFECLAFLVSNDVGDILFDPVFISLFQFRSLIAFAISLGILLVLPKDQGGAERQDKDSHAGPF